MNDQLLFDAKLPWEGESYDSTSLAQRVAEQLREMIMQGRLEPEMQLPTEPELSTRLNVSRSTIRSALTILEQGGFILRRWGVGTFVAKNPTTYNNLNINSGVTQLIRSSGAEPGCVELLIVTRPASEHVANHLGLELGAPVVVVERVRLADERRIVFSVEYLPQDLFKTQDVEVPTEEIEGYLKVNHSMYGFLRERLDLEIHHGVAWIRPLTAESYVAEKLQIPRGSSLLHLEQVDYNLSGNPVALSDEYYVADAFTFSVYRSG
jgi:GntR family transcriptional regulator